MRYQVVIYYKLPMSYDSRSGVNRYTYEDDATQQKVHSHRIGPYSEDLANKRAKEYMRDGGFVTTPDQKKTYIAPTQMISAELRSYQ